MKKLVCVFLTLIIAVGLSACSSGETSSSNNETGGSDQGNSKVIKLGHMFSAGDPLYNGAEYFKETLEKLSDGSITVDIYPNASLGSVDDMIEQVQMDSLDAVLGGFAPFHGEYPAAMIDEVPFLFTGHEHYFAAMDGELGEALQSEVFGKAGMTNLGTWSSGFRHFTNNKGPIVVPEDIKGIKIRSANSPIRLEMFKILGSNAISMPFPEVFSGLQQGTIDGQENPLSLIVSSSFNEVQDYLSLSGHIYNGIPVLFSTKLLESYSDEEQQWIREAMKEATTYQRDLAKEFENEALKTLEADMEVNKIDYDAFFDAVQPVYDYYREKAGDNGWIEMALKAKPN
ncbi:DctP family TRAP transporter solute-binding subunit [Bacillus sp. FJAT-29937]|uniref:DctP family TRAP transporter solute-binding subunit n=1 Tax=Bacillus sp. FJAT-29937 TaxID=1720553 RepID=UPI0008376C3C|nr:DctP family TRAP transporter solute-binding subunit [Bacillus sp. FJAT-29937]